MTPPTVACRASTGTERVRGLTRSRLRELALRVTRPGILSLAGGLPAPELLPTSAYAAALQNVLGRDPGALQYGQPYEPLKQQIVRLLGERGVTCSPEEVLLTSGAQQALSVIAQLLVSPGAQVLMEDQVYTGVRQAVSPYRPTIVTVGTDLESGMDVDAVQAMLTSGARPAFIYAISDTHNPCGVRLSVDKRSWLVELSRHFRIPIVEDDAYGFLHYDGDPLPALRALDNEWVFYVGSFSKIIAPALRLGWVVVPQRLMSAATILKEAADLETSALTQRAVAQFIRDGDFATHLRRLRDGYRLRRDAMLRALRRSFPPTARWTNPPGGLFVWVELPGHVDCSALCEEALEAEHVAFVPGATFSVGKRIAVNCMRLSFAGCSPREIAEGVERITRPLQRRMVRV